MSFQACLIFMLMGLIVCALLAGMSPVVSTLLRLRSAVVFSQFLIIFNLLIGVCFAFLNFYEVVALSVPCYTNLGSWFNVGLLQVNFDFTLDYLSASMAFIVLFISFCVHTYATSYMYFDSSFGRFFVYLPVFTAFMLVLVLSSNLVLLFVGWEGVGIMSYLLVGFWYDNLNNNKCALKALNYNKIGDVSYLLGILLLYSFTKSFDCGVVNSLVPGLINYNVNFFGFSLNFLSVVGFLFFLAVVGKSSQIVFHVWLPDAMAGPTPVSALLHAATMVTAGVYLIIRMSDLFSSVHYLSNLLIVVGSLTALIAGLVGVAQNDLKKIIAYSTCSQLGYMVLACGCQQYLSSFYHLFNHAFFKALLFLGAGAVIHSLSDEQDIRKMGGLVYSMPFTYLSAFVGSLALTGFPFLTGYYSKDVLLELTLSNYEVYPLIAYVIGVLAAMLTAFYSTRSIWYVFLSKYAGPRVNTVSVHEPDNFMMFPVFLLTLCSLFVGYFTCDLYLGFGSVNYQGSLSALNFVHPNAEHLNLFLKFIPLVFSLFGAGSCLIFFLIFPHALSNLGTLPIFSLLRSAFISSFYINSLLNYLYINLWKDVYSTFYVLSDVVLLQIYGPLYTKAKLRKLYNQVRMVKLGSLGVNIYLVCGIYITLFFVLFF